jgi:hypothetical protein
VTEQFPPLPPDSALGSLPRRAHCPNWPRLLREQDAAAYLSIGTTLLRERGPKPKKLGGRTLWDIRDLDRFADALDGQPLDPVDAGSHAQDLERAWREARAKKKGQGNG